PVGAAPLLAFAFGLIVPTLVGWFVVPPQLPAGGTKQRINPFGVAHRIARPSGFSRRSTALSGSGNQRAESALYGKIRTSQRPSCIRAFDHASSGTISRPRW